MRPHYETKEDLAREEKVAILFAGDSGAKAIKLPDRYYIDWMMMRHGHTSAFAECKVRNNARLQYDDYMLSLDKWLHGYQLSLIANVPFLVVVQWTDGTFWYRQGASSVRFGYGGRKDRGDPQDMEPMVFIPARRFQPIKNPEVEV